MAAPRKNSSSSAFSASPSSISFSPATTMSFRYYQPPKPSVADSDSDDYSSEEEFSYGRGRHGSSNESAVMKRTGACTHCKTLKVKCYFTPGETSCQRCQFGNFNCVVYGRKKRRAVPTHEELLQKSRKQDMEIAALLNRIDKLSTERRMSEWLAKSTPMTQNPSMTSSRSSDAGMDALSSYEHFPSHNQGFGSITQYLSTPNVTREQLSREFPDPSFCNTSRAPDIMTCGLLTPRDVSELFALYFQLINPFFSVLDPQLHTPSRLMWNSHFLFTAICAVACRYYANGVRLVEPLAEFARDACGRAFVQGPKTVDTCQAFLIMAVYQKPRPRFDQQRGWLYMGIAFGLAQELQLHNPDIEGIDERERLNRTRTWLNCYCVDASHATQFGKPAMLNVEDYVARHSMDWYKSSRMNLPIDVHLVAYVDVLRIMGQFKREVKPMTDARRKRRTAEEYVQISMRYNDMLEQLFSKWSQRFRDHPQAHEYMCDYRADLHRMINAYSRLVVLSFGFQKAAAEKQRIYRDDPIVRQCIATAQEVIKRMCEHLAPTGYLRYGMEAHFLFVSFAAAFLLNMFKPELSKLLQPGEEGTITQLVQRLIRVLRSEDIKFSLQKHPPVIYARFLQALLNTYCKDAAPTPVEQPQAQSQYQAPSQPPPQTDSSEQLLFHAGASAGYYGYQESDAMTYAQLAGTEMDFSLTNFMQMLSSQPQFQKPSPLPGENVDVWTEMYPVSNQSLSGGFVWPLVMDETPPEVRQYVPEY